MNSTAFRRITVIARNTVVESVRNRVLYVIMVFALIMLLASGAVSQFEEEVQRKLLKDISYAIISFFGLMISLFITIEQVPSEIDRKTIYFVLTKPVYRFEFLLGKFLGVCTVLYANLATMGAVLYLFLGFQTSELDVELAKGLLMLAAKLTIFVSILVFFSTFLSKIVNVALSFFVYFFGHAGEFLEHSFIDSNVFVSWIIGALQLLLPNFTNFDFQISIVHEVLIPWGFLGVLCIYSILFSAFFLLSGHLIFRRRDL